MRTPLHRALCVAAIAALPLAACGDDDEGGGGSGTTEEPAGDAVLVTAVDPLAFEPDALEAPAGEITFRMENDGTTRHTFVIEDREGDLKLETPSGGDTDEGSITLEAGEYVFYCDVSGHRGGGMEGTLTVG